MSVFKLLCIRAFATDYHSGQYSKGYKLLSLSGILLERKGMYHLINKHYYGIRQAALYLELVNKYADKI